MTKLFKFLYRNLKGYRLLVVLAIFITIAEVFAAIAIAFPLKFITSKVQNPGNDPTCTLPFLKPLLDPVLDRFDIPQIAPEQPPQPPELTQCPVSPADHNPILITSHHTVNGVIVFAARIAHNLTARLRNELFDHLQRLSLDWHGKQKKGDLVNRLTGNIADIEKLVADGMVDLLAGILTLVGIIVVMLYLSPTYTLIAMAIIPARISTPSRSSRSLRARKKKLSASEGMSIHRLSTLGNVDEIIVLKAGQIAERGSYTELKKRGGVFATLLEEQNHFHLGLFDFSGRSPDARTTSGSAIDYRPRYSASQRVGE